MAWLGLDSFYSYSNVLLFTLNQRPVSIPNHAIHSTGISLPAANLQNLSTSIAAPSATDESQAKNLALPDGSSALSQTSSSQGIS
ncbi:hypothetical protein H0H81_002823, partial [Sphagnurus paluster]